MQRDGTCAACGTNFAYEGRGRPRRYCRECVPPGTTNAWRAANPQRVAQYNAARRLPTEQRPCLVCGMQFTTGRVARQYCSRRCGDAYRWRRRTERAAAERRDAYRAQRPVMLAQEAEWLLRTARQQERMHGPTGTSIASRERAAQIRQLLKEKRC